VGAHIGAHFVRRAIWIDAKPDDVWEEFTTIERMRAWYGTGHTLVQYEPRLGGVVETDAASDVATHGEDAPPLRFVGTVVVFEPGRELTFEQDWVGHGWTTPPLITIRLTEHDGGTIVELFHHGFGADDQAGFEEGWTNRQLVALRERVAAQ